MSKNKINSPFEYKLIYIFKIHDEAHFECIKIGDTTVSTPLPVSDLKDDCNILNVAAKKRIDSCTQTACIKYELIYTTLAIRKTDGTPFIDKTVHTVLKNSGIKKVIINGCSGIEWFKISVDVGKNAINAAKDGRSSLNPNEKNPKRTRIEFRPEQNEAIEATVKAFKKKNNSHRFLWNAKMRFGKTISAMEVVKRMNFAKTLIITHRPIVSSGWRDDFDKIFYEENTTFGFQTGDCKKTSDVHAFEIFLKSHSNIVYFTSMQDLRGSHTVGGEYEKNEKLFATQWDFIIIDEAHEGIRTEIGNNVVNKLRESNPECNILELSGTPFNLVEDYKENEIYTWDYINEQAAKEEWDSERLDPNPYSDLPKLNILTFDLAKEIKGFISSEDDGEKAFNFREFFRTWSGNISKDFKEIPNGKKIGEFVHEERVKSFLNLISKDSQDSKYPFANDLHREYFKNTFWILPGVEATKAMKCLLEKHQIFGSNYFKIINVGGDGIKGNDDKDPLIAVRDAIKDDKHPYTITLSCGRLTTGVTIPEWTGVLLLNGSTSSIGEHTISASLYLQTIFRVQSPGTIDGKVKTNCYAFDFAPDRALKMITKSMSISKGNLTSEEDIKSRLGKFINFCPIISVDGTRMVDLDTKAIMVQVKKVLIDKVVSSGFESDCLYNDEEFKNLTNDDLISFKDLQAQIGKTQKSKKITDILLNAQGLTNAQYEQIEQIKKKQQKELTSEEIDLINKKKELDKQKKNAITILRGISIRLPMIAYGANISTNEEITIDNITEIIDDHSWREFMPRGVDKGSFNKFKKYYNKDVLCAATKKIRTACMLCDGLDPLERIKKIIEIFSTFRNPDKETVLTPWKVVNMHMGESIGGYNFYDEIFVNQLDKPRYIIIDDVTTNIFNKKDAKILEINSKSGLYPLYLAFSLYQRKIKEKNNELTLEQKYNIWVEIIQKNIFVLCNTEMAKHITYRTLLGYREEKCNIRYFDDLVNQISQISKRENVIRKVTSKKDYWETQGGQKQMKFDVIVGNPPYQIIDGGGVGDSAKPIYHFFVEWAKKIEPQYLSMIMPSRWMQGGKGLANFREIMMEDKSIRFVADFADSKVCFSTVNIDGGVCYFLRDKEYNGKTKYKYHSFDGNISESFRYLKSGSSDTVIRNKNFLSIIEKTNTKNKFSSIVSKQNPYGFRTDFFNAPEKFQKCKISHEIKPNYVQIFGVKGQKGGAKRTSCYIVRESVPKNIDSIDKFKLFFSKAYMATSTLFPDVIVGKSGDICTETFLEIGPFETLEHAENCLEYMLTKFFRTLLFLNRSSLNISTSIFNLIPLLSFDKIYTDEELFNMFELSKTEIEYINKLIKD